MRPSLFSRARSKFGVSQITKTHLRNSCYNLTPQTLERFGKIIMYLNCNIIKRWVILEVFKFKVIVLKVLQLETVWRWYLELESSVVLLRWMFVIGDGRYSIVFVEMTHFQRQCVRTRNPSELKIFQGS